MYVNYRFCAWCSKVSRGTRISVYFKCYFLNWSPDENSNYFYLIYTRDLNYTFFYVEYDSFAWKLKKPWLEIDLGEGLQFAWHDMTFRVFFSNIVFKKLPKVPKNDTEINQIQIWRDLKYNICVRFIVLNYMHATHTNTHIICFSFFSFFFQKRRCRNWNCQILGKIFHLCVCLVCVCWVFSKHHYCSALLLF